LNLAKKLTSYSSHPSSLLEAYTLFTNSTNHPILYNIKNLENAYTNQFYTYVSYQPLSTINSATNIDRVLNYLDDTTGKGRRVDLNFLTLNFATGSG